MKVAIIQPPYPEAGGALNVLAWQINELHKILPGDTI